MTEWIERLIPYLATQVRGPVGGAHPSGRNLDGRPIGGGDHHARSLPELPAHIHLIGPAEKVNTYDLMEITDLAWSIRPLPAWKWHCAASRCWSAGGRIIGEGFYPGCGYLGRIFLPILDKALADLPGHRLTAGANGTGLELCLSLLPRVSHPFPGIWKKSGKDLEKGSHGLCAEPGRTS